MTVRVFVCGYGSDTLTGDLLKNFDTHVSKWKSESWAIDAYAPFDSRDARFSDVLQSLEEDQKQRSGNPLIIFDDITIESSELDRVMNAIQELKIILPDFIFEAHTEEKRLL